MVHQNIQCRGLFSAFFTVGTDHAPPAMQQLGNDAAMRVRMGYASRKRVQEIYAVEKVNAALMQIMDL